MGVGNYLSIRAHESGLEGNPTLASSIPMRGAKISQGPVIFSTADVESSGICCGHDDFLRDTCVAIAMRVPQGVSVLLFALPG